MDDSEPTGYAAARKEAARAFTGTYAAIGVLGVALAEVLPEITPVGSALVLHGAAIACLGFALAVGIGLLKELKWAATTATAAGAGAAFGLVLLAWTIWAVIKFPELNEPRHGRLTPSVAPFVPLGLVVCTLVKTWSLVSERPGSPTEDLLAGADPDLADDYHRAGVHSLKLAPARRISSLVVIAVSAGFFFVALGICVAGYGLLQGFL